MTKISNSRTPSGETTPGRGRYVFSRILAAGVAVFALLGAVTVASVSSAATTSWQVVNTYSSNGSNAVIIDHAHNTLWEADRFGNQVTGHDLTSGALVQNIAVGNSPIAMGFDIATHTLWVANYGSNTTSVIDTNTDAVIATLSTGGFTTGVTVNQSTNTVYVVASNTMWVYNGSTQALITTVNITSSPFNPGVDQTTGTIYVASQSGAYLQEIDPSTYAITTVNLPSGSNPQTVQVNSTTHTAYVVNRGNNTVSVVNGSTLATPITVGSAPQTVAIDDASDTILVTNTGDQTVSIIDGASGVVTQTLSIPSTYGAYGAAWDATTSSFYVSNYNSTTSGTVSQLKLGTSPTVSVAALTSGNVGNAYSKPVTASGTGPITFALTTGSLPPGLTLDPNTGVISGTPTTAGTYTYSVTATNLFGTDTASYTQVIGAHLPVVAG